MRFIDYIILNTFIQSGRIMHSLEIPSDYHLQAGCFNHQSPKLYHRYQLVIQPGCRNILGNGKRVALPGLGCLEMLSKESALLDAVSKFSIG